mmetsp:Transcript_4160/g.10066  ORF Transcript_4160/g.10066 Transcript_4160/m.10066 type:complete len:269 (+) Transcript_4160:4478-5284(+)
MHKALVSDIVDVHKVGLPLRGKVSVVDSISVILRRDVNLVSQHVLYGLIMTAVSKLELVGLATGCAGKKLIAKTDAEDRDVLLQGPSQVGNGLLAHSRISRSVGDEEAVKPLLLDIPVPWNNRHADSGGTQGSDDVVLDAAIDSKDVHVTRAERHRHLGRHVGNQVQHVGIAERNILLHYNLSLHAAVHAQLLGQRTGVNSVHAGDVVLLEPGRKRLVGVPMRGEVAVILADHSRDLNAIALHARGQTELIRRRMLHAVVTQQRIRVH